MCASLPSLSEINTALESLFVKAYAKSGDEILSALLVIGRDLPGHQGEVYKVIDYVPEYEMGELCDSINFFQSLALASDDCIIRTRLHVLMYCHIVEANFPFLVIHNLLNLIEGGETSNAFTMAPGKKRRKGKTKVVLEYPKDKIPVLKKMADRNDLKIGEILERLWEPALRNAFSHSEYTIMKDGCFWITAGSSSSSKPRRQVGCDLTAAGIEKLSIAIRCYLWDFAKEYELYIRPYADGKPHPINAGTVQWDPKHCWVWA